jgi:hypothetical protein
MSNVILKEGWVVDNPRLSSDIIRATIPQKDNLGRTIPVVVISNIKTGNFDVYEVPTVQLGGSTIPIPNAPLGSPLFRYDATNDKPVPVSRDIPGLKNLYVGTNGQNQLNNLITSVKRSTYENARLNTGTDPIRNQNFENIKNKKGYQSIANTTQTPAQQPAVAPAPSPTSTPVSTDTTGGTSPTESTQTPEVRNQIQSLVKEKKLFPPTDARLQYPKKISDNQDKIKFIACEIGERPAPTGTNFQFEFAKPTYKVAANPLVIAIQTPISDQNTVEWGPDSINAIQSAGYYLSKTATVTKGTPIDKQLKDFATNLTGNAAKYESQLLAAINGAAVGINNILARTDNVVLNPNLELLFQGPQLRPFTFQFKMSARSKDEAKEIKSIIKYFKYHMAVRKTDDNLFLKAPYVFTIQYLKGNNPKHPGINLISPTNDSKACALLNCSVDYTPLGSYMTFRDDPKDPDVNGTMVSYNLSLQFQELEPVYDTDYIEHPHQIGF